MGGKKKPGRFTLQFNLEDPQQRAVSELLEQQGRRKAQFITSAVLLYTQCPKPQGHDGGAPAVDEAALERMLLSILEKHPQLAAAASKEPPVSPAKGTREPLIEDDTLKAITDTLAAFQQQP